MSQTGKEDGASRSLTAAAMSGGLWTGMLVVANKVVSLLGTVCLMYLLVPAEFGIAAVALSILSYLVVMPAFTLSDVLLARSSDSERLMATAFRLCAAVTIPTTILLIAAGFWAADHYGQPQFVGACLIISLRPLADLALLVPSTRLRARLDFRRMAVIDGTTHAGSIVLAIAMAALGAGYFSLLLPQIASTAVRAAFYAKAANRGSPRLSRTWLSGEWRKLMGDYALSGFGQYMHGALLMAPPLVIAQFVDETSVGWYSSAYALSGSVNVVVAVSIGLVLQPIFAKMAGDHRRQSEAFVRSCAAIAAVSMPLCLCQCVLFGPAFRMFLPASWGGAILMGQMMSVGQAFYFAVNPAMGLLKAQGRFATFLTWQSSQFVVVAAAMIIAGSLADSDAALWIVGVCSLYHPISSPLGVWLCLHREQRIGRSLMTIFVMPFIAAALAVAPAALILLIPAGRLADTVVLLGVPLAAAVIYPLLLRFLAPVTYGECKNMLSAIRAKMFGR